MKLRILVDEEYGYRSWLWEPEQETVDGILEYFQNVVQGDWFCEDPSEQFTGSWEPLTAFEEMEIREGGFYEGFAHIHDGEDSRLTLHTTDGERAV